MQRMASLLSRDGAAAVLRGRAGATAPLVRAMSTSSSVLHGVLPPQAPASGVTLASVAAVAAESVRSAALSPPAAPAAAPIIFVKMGTSGKDSDVEIRFETLLGMTRTDVLRALMRDDAFTTKMGGAPQSKCSVWLLPSVAGKKPTADEEAAAVELRAAKTVNDLLTLHRWAPAPHLFVRVRLPAHAGVAGPEWMPLESDHEFSRLVTAIRNNGVRETAEGHLELTGEGAAWPYLNCPLLFVRSFYRDLYDGVMNGCRDPDMLHQLTGQRGSGKSIFGLYALYRALKEGRSVVYAALVQLECYAIPGPAFSDCAVVSRCIIRTHDITVRSPLLKHRDTLYILDGCRLQARSCAALQIGAPELVRTISPSEETDNRSLTLTMPMYTADELLKYREASLPRVTVDDALYRMSCWGPSPRFSITMSRYNQLSHMSWNLRGLSAGSVMTQDAGIQDAVSSAFMQTCKGRQAYDSSTAPAVGGSSSSTAAGVAVSKSLPTTRDSEYYEPGPLMWTSLPLAHLVLTDRATTKEQALQLLSDIQIAQTAEPSVTNIMSGHILRGLATLTLRFGGTFKMTPLALPDMAAATTFADMSKRSEDVVVEPREHMSFDSVTQLAEWVEDLSDTPSFVLHAKNRDECGVDGVIKVPDGRFVLYCTTFDSSHPVVLRTKDGTGGIIPIASALGLLRTNAAGTLPPINVAFMVPNAPEPRFKTVQAVEGATDADARLVRDALIQHIIMLPTRPFQVHNDALGDEPLQRALEACAGLRAAPATMEMVEDHLEQALRHNHDDT